jgi:hypothetical protein
MSKIFATMYIDQEKLLQIDVDAKKLNIIQDFQKQETNIIYVGVYPLGNN